MDFLDEIISGVSLTKIDDLYDDALGLVLWEAREYGPALVQVCRHWASKVAGKSAFREGGISVVTVARRGHASLLAWICQQWPYKLSSTFAVQLASARGGHWGQLNMILGWGSPPEPIAITQGAAEAGDAKMLEVVLQWSESLWPPSSQDATLARMRLDIIMRIGAENGHEAVCQVARAWGADDYGQMAIAAIRKGNESLFYLALAWNGICFGNWTTSQLLIAGVDHDHERGGLRMCELAKENGARDYNTMLSHAAFVGDERLCQQARRWGASDFDAMLNSAAMGGHESLCDLAIRWGSENFGGMLIEAANYGHLSLCQKAVAIMRGNDHWDEDEIADLVTEGLAVAAEAGHEAICCHLLDCGGDPCTLLVAASSTYSLRLFWLALEHGAVVEELYEPGEEYTRFESIMLECSPGDYDEVLYRGAGLYEMCDMRNACGACNEDCGSCGEGYEICSAALEAGARHADWLLGRGAYLGRENLCWHALRNGARDFNGMLLGACAGGHGDLVDLARKWGATARELPAETLCQVLAD